MISGSSSAGVTAQDAGSQSATESVKHATSVTEKVRDPDRSTRPPYRPRPSPARPETSTRILKKHECHRPDSD